MLEGTGDTADVHPAYDKHVATAIDISEAELRRGGYVTPLDVPLQDLALQRAMIAILIDVATKTSSSRESWVDEFAKWGRGYLSRIGDGEITIEGVALGGSGAAESGGVLGAHFRERYAFDLDDPYAEVNSVFADLGPWPGRIPG